MQSMNKNEKEFTDQQWDDLLNQTFEDPVSAPKAPEPKPEPEPLPPVQTAPMPPQPAPKKSRKRRLKTKHWIVLAVSAAVLIAGLCIFLYCRFGPTKEQKQCMEALQQWQTAQYYQLKHSVYVVGNSGGIYNATINAEYTNLSSHYLYGGENNLVWHFFATDAGRYFVGKAQKGESWFAYSSNTLNGSKWTPTVDHTPVPTLWIRSFSLDDVQILHQQVQQESEHITAITFAVMDTNPDAELYGKGPYHLQFMFRDGQMYSVSRGWTSAPYYTTTVEYFNFDALPADVIEGILQSQLMNPQTTPYFDFTSSTIRYKTQTDPAE